VRLRSGSLPSTANAPIENWPLPGYEHVAALP
jgi:hypothetical protein